MVKLVICRSDLPTNPRWREEGYPFQTCWDVDEFFESPLVPFEEKRRIFWEAYWRLMGRYRRGRPFFKSYIIKDTVPLPVDRQRWVLENIVTSAIAHGIVPREALEYTYKVYKPLFKRTP